MGFVAKRVNEFNIGHWAISKFWWTVSIIILLKLYEVEWWVFPIAFLILVILTLILGMIIHRSGLWDNFIKVNLRAIKEGK